MEIFGQHIEEKSVRILGEHRFDPNHRKEGVYRLIKAMLEAHEPYPQFHREVLAMRYSDPEVESVSDEVDERILQHTAALVPPGDIDADVAAWLRAAAALSNAATQ